MEVNLSIETLVITVASGRKTARSTDLDAIRPPYKYISELMIAASQFRMLSSTHCVREPSGAAVFMDGSRDGGGVRILNGVTSARFRNASLVVKRSSNGRKSTVCPLARVKKRRTRRAKMDWDMWWAAFNYHWRPCRLVQRQIHKQTGG